MFRRADIIIVIAVIIIGAIALFIAIRPQGEYVEITLNSELIYRLPLNEDKIIILEDIGAIEIKDNTVIMYESTCPDQLCVIQGRISKTGQSIICLPNRLVITIRGKSEWDIIV